VDSRDAPGDELRALAGRHGSSVNDICLAALALALGSDPPLTTAPGPAHGLAVALPMSYRTHAQRYTPGNRMLPGRLELPLQAKDLAEAVRHVRRTTEPLRRHRAKDSRRAALELLPGALGTAVGLSGTRGTEAVASSMTFPVPVHVNGARMTGAWALFPPDESLAAYFSFTRAGGRLRFTLVHDTSVPLPDRLPERWLHALGLAPQHQYQHRGHAADGD
jgi:hypothetical protein